MKRHFAPIAVWLFAAALMPVQVSAQLIGSDSPPPESVRRPYRGLFTGLSDAKTPQSLVATASLYGAYDDNILSGLTNRSTNDWRYQESGYYSGAHAALGYSIARTANRVSFSGHANAAVRYYRHEDRSSTAPNYSAAGDVGFALSRSTRFNVGHLTAFSRAYRFSVLPMGEEEVPVDDPSIPELDLDLFNYGAFRNTSHATLSQALGRNASFAVGYRFRAVDFVDEPEDEPAPGQLRDYRTHSGSARIQYNRPMTAHAQINLGYGIRVSDGVHGTGEPRTMHDVRAGVSYSRALSISRRTAVGFSTGSALAVVDDVSGVQRDPKMHFNVIGNANLTHELGRTWTARVGYFRGFVFKEGYDEPHFTDSVNAGIGGLVTRRLSASARATWALSKLQRTGQTGQNSFAGVAQTTYALNGFLALFANYVYYTYDTEEDLPLDPKFPRALDRQGVRVGLTASFPLIR
jgi:hypothetical protein